MRNIFIPENIFEKEYLFFHQGDTGDCWLLATIISLVKGGYNINNIIEETKDNNYVVTLKGIRKKFLITQDMLKTEYKLSRGDKKIKAIEIAVKRYQKDNHIKRFLKVDDSVSEMYRVGYRASDYNELDSNIIEYAYFLLTGLKTKTFIMSEHSAVDKYHINVKQLFSIFNNHEDYYITLGTDSNPAYKNILPHHAYAVTGFKGRNIILIDPNNAVNEISVNANELLGKNFSIVTVKKH